MTPVTRIDKGVDARMAVIETNISYIKEEITENKELNKEQHAQIMAKMDDFIQSANKTYATKEEVANIKVEFKNHKTASSDWLRTLAPSAIMLVVTIVGWIIMIKLKS